MKKMILCLAVLVTGILTSHAQLTEKMVRNTNDSTGTGGLHTRSDVSYYIDGKPVLAIPVATNAKATNTKTVSLTRSTEKKVNNKKSAPASTAVQSSQPLIKLER